MSLNGVNGFNPMEKPNFTNTTPLKGDEVDVTKKSLLPSEPKKPESQGPIEHTDDVPKGSSGNPVDRADAHQKKLDEIADLKNRAVNSPQSHWENVDDGQGGNTQKFVEGNSGYWTIVPDGQGGNIQKWVENKSDN